MFFKLDPRLSVLSEHWTQLKEKSAQRKQDLEDSLQVPMPLNFYSPSLTLSQSTRVFVPDKLFQVGFRFVGKADSLP